MQSLTRLFDENVDEKEFLSLKLLLRAEVHHFAKFPLFMTKTCIYTCALQFYIAYGEYYAIYLSCGIGGMHDEYVFTRVLFYYGMLKTSKGEYGVVAFCIVFLFIKCWTSYVIFLELEWFRWGENNVVCYGIRVYGFQYFSILLHWWDSHGTGISLK